MCKSALEAESLKDPFSLPPCDAGIKVVDVYRHSGGCPFLPSRPDKNALRRQARQRRRSLSPEQRLPAQQRVLDYLRARAAADGWRRIGAYLAVASELDLAPLFQSLPGIQWFLPSIETGDVMRFRSWAPGTPLVTGPFSIPQPPPDAPEADPRTLDAVLLPLLGFDARGARLGSGAGYYDRCFAFRHGTDRPLLVGIAFAVQRFQDLPTDCWDVCLDAVVTEDGWLDCSR